MSRWQLREEGAPPHFGDVAVDPGVPPPDCVNRHVIVLGKSFGSCRGPFPAFIGYHMHLKLVWNVLGELYAENIGLVMSDALTVFGALK